MCGLDILYITKLTTKYKSNMNSVYHFLLLLTLYVWYQAVKRFIVPYLSGHCVNNLLDIVEKTTLETYLHVPTQGPEN